MKRLPWFSGILISALFSCKTGDLKPVTSPNPPFDSFAFTAKMKIPNLTSSDFKPNKYFILGDMHSAVISGEYAYLLINTYPGYSIDDVLPLPNTVKFTFQNSASGFDILTSGAMPLLGTNLPTIYTGDKSLWASNVDYVIAISIRNGIVKSATITLTNSKISAAYDLKNVMQFYYQSANVSTGGTIANDSFGVGTAGEIIGEFHDFTVQLEFDVKP